MPVKFLDTHLVTQRVSCRVAKVERPRPRLEPRGGGTRQPRFGPAWLGGPASVSGPEEQGQGDNQPEYPDDRSQCRAAAPFPVWAAVLGSTILAHGGSLPEGRVVPLASGDEPRELTCGGTISGMESTLCVEQRHPMPSIWRCLSHPSVFGVTPEVGIGHMVDVAEPTAQ